MNKYKIIISGLSGAITVLAFAPLQWWWVALMSVALFATIIIDASSPRRAAYQGFSFGLGYFLAGVSWVFVSIHEYGDTSAWLAALMTLLFCALLAVFPSIAALLSWSQRRSPWRLCLTLPAAWVLSEALRSVLFTGFPWLLLGYSQTQGPLAALAPVVGVYGLSAILMLIGTGVACTWRIGTARIALVTTSVAALLFAGSWLPLAPWTHPVTAPQSVALVQSNIGQAQKWDETLAQQALTKYQNLSHNHWQKRMVVWPESALPIPWPFVMDDLAALLPTIQQHQATLITGVPVIADEQHIFNGIISVGKFTGYYNKHHLVPFGEFVPLSHVLRKLGGIFALPMSDFQRGPLQQAPLTVNHLKLAPFICYEIAYSDSVLNHTREANALLTINNDAWFGHSLAAAQHLQIAQMRSLQTGRPQLFVSNTGMTAIIAANGRIQHALAPYQAAVLDGKIRGYAGTTPWQQFGDTPLLWLSALITLMMNLASVYNARRYPQ